MAPSHLQEMHQIQDPDPYRYPARQPRVQTLEPGGTNSDRAIHSSAFPVHPENQLTGLTVPTLPRGSSLAQPRLSFGASDNHYSDSVNESVVAHEMPKRVELKPLVDELGVLDDSIVDGFVGVVMDTNSNN